MTKTLNELVEGWFVNFLGDAENAYKVGIEARNPRQFTKLFAKAFKAGALEERQRIIDMLSVMSCSCCKRIQAGEHENTR